ncbi:MAG TPA: hypothetical protein VGM14_27890 [Streptosporangiaceae bacterium]|jgi:hypothetical protein
MADGNVTQIDTAYLNKFKGQIDQLRSDVEVQIRGIGPSNDPATTNYINPVDNLTLLAGPPGFDAGVALANALKTTGGSVYSQLQWLDKVLKDMSEEITTTVSSLNDTESLNNDAVDGLIKDFKNTIGDMSNPPGSSSTQNPNTPPANPNTPPAG